MPPDAQARLMDNIVEAMQGVPAEIVERRIGHFYKADAAYGRGVAQRRTEHRQTRSRGGGVGGEATGAGRNAPAAHSILTTKVGPR